MRNRLHNDKYMVNESHVVENMLKPRGHISHFLSISSLIKLALLLLFTGFSLIAVSKGLLDISAIYHFISRKALGPPVEAIAEVPWSDDAKELLSAHHQDFPKVIRGCPLNVNPSDLPEIILESKALPQFVSVAVGKDHNRHFMYRSSDTRWNGLVNNSLYEFKRIESASFLDMMFSGSRLPEASARDFYYFGQTLDRPAMHPFVQQVAPYFASEIASHTAYNHPRSAALPRQTRRQLESPPAFMRLWLSSPGAVTTMHYDVERNFFLQLRGFKTFVLASPDAYLFLKPHSFLHPHWRQSQLGNISTLDQFVDAAASYLESLISRKYLNCSEIYALNPARRRPLDPVCSYEAVLAQVPPSSSDGAIIKARRDAARRIFGLSEVTLRAGDMLHLPPFAFHCVTAGADSVSVNAWIGSEEYSVAKRIRNQIPLPFESNDKLADKLLGIRFMIFRLFPLFAFKGIEGMQYRIFIDTLRSRFSFPWNNDNLGGVIDEDSFDFCTWDFTDREISLCQKGCNTRVNNSASILESVLDAIPANRQAVKNILISDYFDGIMDLAFTERQSSPDGGWKIGAPTEGHREAIMRPSFVLSFIASCLVPPTF